MPFQHFTNTLVEMRIAGSSQVFEGWLKPDSEGILLIQMEDVWPDLHYGTEVIANLSTITLSTVINCTFIGSEGDIAMFTMPSSFVRMAGNPDARIRQRVITAKVQYKSNVAECRVTDISRKGMGLITPWMVEPEEMLKVQVLRVSHEFNIDLRVVFAKRAFMNEENWRVGGKIENMIRTDQVRWQRLLVNELD